MERETHSLDIYFLTIFPEFFEGPLSTSILKRAQEAGHATYNTVFIRDFAQDKHKMTDDNPYGGGAGMVMKVGPVVRAIESLAEQRKDQGLGKALTIAMTPGGVPMTQSLAQKLAAEPALAFVCGRYEGIDERAYPYIDLQISLGDFVLTGGEPAALAIADATVRLRDGVLGNAASAEDESFSDGLLEYPHYTRPETFRGARVPAVLRSGHHAAIEAWRRGQSLLRTAERRPDLFEKLSLTRADEKLLQQAKAWREEHAAYEAEEN